MNTVRMRNANMIWAKSNKVAVLLVQIIRCVRELVIARPVQRPEVGEVSKCRTRIFVQVKSVTEIRQGVVKLQVLKLASTHQSSVIMIPLTAKRMTGKRARAIRR